MGRKRATDGDRAKRRWVIDLTSSTCRGGQMWLKQSGNVSTALIWLSKRWTGTLKYTWPPWIFTRTFFYHFQIETWGVKSCFQSTLCKGKSIFHCLLRTRICDLKIFVSLCLQLIYDIRFRIIQARVPESVFVNLKHPKSSFLQNQSKEIPESGSKHHSFCRRI